MHILLPLGAANSYKRIWLSIHYGVFDTEKPEGKANRDLQVLQTILCFWKTSALTGSGGLHVFKASNWKAIFGSLLLSEPKVM